MDRPTDRRQLMQRRDWCARMLEIERGAQMRNGPVRFPIRFSEFISLKSNTVLLFSEMNSENLIGKLSQKKRRSTDPLDLALCRSFENRSCALKSGDSQRRFLSPACPLWHFGSHHLPLAQAIYRLLSSKLETGAKVILVYSKFITVLARLTPASLGLVG